MREDRQRFLDDYAATSREFSDAVCRLQNLTTDTETFIRALGETGTAHRACVKSRIRLGNHLKDTAGLTCGPFDRA